MKNLLLGAVSAVALLTAGSAFAAGNVSTIDQIGTGNNAAVDQTGSPSDAVATITQGLAATQNTDADNSASVTQGGGAGNVATVTQSQGAFGATRSPSNIANSNQQGTDGLITVIQVGDSSSSVSQLNGSSGEYSLVGQSGVGSSSTISQGGTNEFALVNQEEGSGNSASITQAGTGEGNANQGAGNYAPTQPSPRFHGPGNLFWSENLPSDSVIPGSSAGNTRYGQTGADIDQVGSNNIGAVNQSGLDNFADVSQENDTGTGGNNGTVIQSAGQTASEAVMYELGQNNTAAINQTGAGSNYSTVWQDGNSNQATSTQSGTGASSIISQGVIGDGPLGTFVGGANNNVASVDQGNDETSTVTQTGSNDTANVFQTVVANATSTVTQGGSFNTATVHQ